MCVNQQHIKDTHYSKEGINFVIVEFKKDEINSKFL